MAAITPFETRGLRPIARFGHTMTFLAPNKVVLFGGATGTAGKYTITADTFVLDMITRVWTNLAYASGTPPSPRAAHAACEGDAQVVYIYGGATGGGSLASDDLFMVDLRAGEDRAAWVIPQIVGVTPGRRYGHTLCFSKPLLLLFGGNTGMETLGDVWALDLSSSLLTWSKLQVENQGPGPRAYHSAAMCFVGPAMNMMVVFGGRGESQISLSDTWGLRRHRDGRWDWVSAPSKSPSMPLARYQHTCLFHDTFLLLLGGRTASVEDPVPVEVYDTNTSEWRRCAAMDRFRHASWAIRGEVYIHGGFFPESPNVPTDSLLKIDLASLLELPSELRPESSPLEPTRPLPAVPRTGNRTPNIHLATHAIVSFGNGTDMGGDTHGDMMRKVSIERLQEEGKRIGAKALPPGISKEKGGDDSPADVVLRVLLKPSNPAAPDFPISKETLSQLIDQCTEIVREQPIIAYLRPPVKIFGGLFGQYIDLLRYFDTFGEPSDTAGGDIESFDYLFLGDYVGRGCKGLEVMSVLMALKVRYPDQVTLLRGHLEDPTQASLYGFQEECASRLSEDPQSASSLFARFTALFEQLPLAAVLDDSILCVHAGIGKSWRHVDQLSALNRPARVARPPGNSEEQLLLDILWSDPMENDKGSGTVANTFRDADGSIVRYSSERLQQFLSDNSFVLMVRSHECVLSGYDRCAMNKLITVCSATDYCGKYRNAGAMLVVKRNMEIVPKLLNPTGDSVGLWREDRKRPPTPPRLRGSR